MESPITVKTSTYCKIILNKNSNVHHLKSNK